MSMNGHRISTLGNLTTLISSGSTPLGGQAVYLDDGPVMLIRSQNVRMNRLDISDVAYISNEIDSQMQRSVIQHEDVLLNITGASIGRVARFGIENARANVNQHVCIIRPKPEELNSRYLEYFLSSPSVQNDIHNRFQHGGTRQALTFSQISKFEIPLPALSEQRRIADILDKADEIRSKRKEAAKRLAVFPHALFQEMFGHPDTNPKNWPFLRFSEVCDSRLGKMLDAKQQTGQNPRPYMRNINVQWGRLDLSCIFEMDFSESDRGEFRLQYGDVLICEGGAGVGQTAIWRDELPECYFQKSLHRVRPYPDRATPEYIAFLIWTLMKGSSLLGSISSATIPHLTGEKLKEFRIPVPPLELQRCFSKQCLQFDSSDQNASHAILQAGDLFNSLVQRAFKGEL